MAPLARGEERVSAVLARKRIARRKSVAKPKPPNVRAAILDAARDLYFAHGADGVSARKIASLVGCSATTIYIYYESLDDLLHHLRMESFARLTQALEASRQDGALASIVAMGEAYFRFGIEHPNDYELMFFYRFREVPKPEVVQREIYALTLLRDRVKAGVESGEIRSDVDLMVLTNALWAEIHGITALAVSGRLWQTAPGQQDAVLAAMFDGIARWLAPAPAIG